MNSLLSLTHKKEDEIVNINSNIDTLLEEADYFREQGLYEMALDKYRTVLSIDKYNQSARLGEIKIIEVQQHNEDQKYRDTRNQMLLDVTESWQKNSENIETKHSSDNRHQIYNPNDKFTMELKKLIIREVNFNNTPLSEVIEFLRRESQNSMNLATPINIIIQDEFNNSVEENISTKNSDNSEPNITLHLKNIPLFFVIKYICELINFKIKVENNMLIITPINLEQNKLVTKVYHTSSILFVSNNRNITSNEHQQKINAKEFFMDQGISFPTGTLAVYFPSSSVLVVRNTPENIDFINTLIHSMQRDVPEQILIETKFVEINQNNNKELGFDWLLGPFKIGGGIYGNGGTPTRDNLRNPMNNGSILNRIGILRSGNEAVYGNIVDAAINGNIGNNEPAPTIFSFSGILTKPQFQVAIRALNQKTGLDLISAPTVTVQNGSRAIIRIVDEFIYPKQYDPPQIPQIVSNNIGIPPTITPSFPHDFTKSDLGVILETAATITPDHSSIDLYLNPKVTSFDGFIDYGSPIRGVGYSSLTVMLENGIIGYKPIAQSLTSNTIKQPVFSTREVNTFVTIHNGDTIVLGGLIRDDIQQTKDKIPILGDIPIAGRLFQSNVQQKVKKNLLIFVTPRILGQPKIYHHIPDS